MSLPTSPAKDYSYIKDLPFEDLLDHPSDNMSYDEMKARADRLRELRQSPPARRAEKAKAERRIVAQKASKLNLNDLLNL